MSTSGQQQASYVPANIQAQHIFEKAPDFNLFIPDGHESRYELYSDLRKSLEFIDTVLAQVLARGVLQFDENEYHRKTIA